MENNILKIRENIKNNYIYWFLILQPILDMIAYFQRESAISLAGYIRLSITFVVPLYALIKTKKKKKFICVMAIIALFSVMHIANGFRVGYISFFQDVKYLLLVLHMPLVAISLIFLDDKRIEKQVPKAFITNFLVITCVVVISYVTGTGNSTYIGYDYGWTGWFLIPNAQSIILVGLVPFALYAVISKSKLWQMLIMNAVVVSMLIVNGTKTAYYSIFLISLGYIVFLVFDYFIQKRERFPHMLVGVFLLVIIFGRLLYSISPRADMDSTYFFAREAEQVELDQLKDKEIKDEETKNQDTIKEIVYEKYLDEYLVEKFGYDKVIKEYGDNPTAVDFSDMRLKKKIYAKRVWENCDLVTKLVGFQYPEMQFKGENFDLENDPPAILYYYGYIGAILYIVFFAIVFIRIISSAIFDFYKTVNLYNFALLSTFLLQIALSFNSGYLLRRPNVSVYLATVVALCFQRTKQKNKGE